MEGGIALADIEVDEAAFYGRHAFGRFPEQVSVWDFFYDCREYVGRHRSEREPLSGDDLNLWVDFYRLDGFELMSYIDN